MSGCFPCTMCNRCGQFDFVKKKLACPECGAQLKPGSRQCPRCGEPLSYPVPKEAPAAGKAIERRV